MRVSEQVHTNTSTTEVNQAEKAEMVLDQVLGGAFDENQSPEEIDVKEAMRERKVLDPETGRTASRILFVTKDPQYLSEAGGRVEEMKQRAPWFDEIHILVLLRQNTKTKTRRLAPNVWAYGVTYKNVLQLRSVITDFAESQLMFGGVFRPDIVVGLDCFEDGLAGYLLAKRYDKAFQLQVHTDIFSKAYKSKSQFPTVQKYMAKWVLKRSKSVRANSEEIKKDITKYVGDKVVLRLPLTINFESLLDGEASFDVHERYKDFTFVILTVGPLQADSPLHDVFAELHPVLRNPRIGMVVVGDGPGREIFRKKAEILGVSESVVFVFEETDLFSYLKSCDVCIIPETAPESEKIMLKAAAAGIPLVMRSTPLRKELFEDRQSAFLCEKAESFCLKQSVNKLLNDNATRKQFREAGPRIIESRIDRDEDSYYRSYRDSIEYALLECVE